MHLLLSLNSAALLLGLVAALPQPQYNLFDIENFINDTPQYIDTPQYTDTQYRANKLALVKSPGLEDSSTDTYSPSSQYIAAAEETVDANICLNSDQKAKQLACCETVDGKKNGSRCRPFSVDEASCPAPTTPFCCELYTFGVSSLPSRIGQRFLSSPHGYDIDLELRDPTPRAALTLCSDKVNLG